MKRYLEIISINEHSIIPVYRQLADALVKGVEIGQINKNEVLPSLHNFCTALEVSKNSVEKAYNTLKKQGVVGSVRGKGYYVI